MAALAVTRAQAVAYRLRANHLDRRLPAGSVVEAARFGLQDTIPRAALIALHARVEAVGPSDWEDPRLVQLWSPRSAVYVVPEEDRAVFTLGRMPRQGAEADAVRAAAERVRSALGGVPRRKTEMVHVLGGEPREAMALMFRATIAGTVAIRWDARDTVVRDVPAPDAGAEPARLELARRHLRAFGPSTPEAFAWWAGVGRADALATWRALADELLPVDVDGRAAWLLREDESRLRSPEPIEGARFLPAEELKLFGQDRAGLFAGPAAVHRPRPPFDTFHPNGLLVDSELVGAWGRRGGRVDARLWRPVAERARQLIEAEALSIPIPGAAMSLALDT